LSSKRDYYEVLGVPRSASEDELKRAYRSQARKFHPDINKEPGAEERFKEVNEAYEILSDGDKRARYDRFGHAGVEGGAAGAGGFGFGSSPFEDIFESFFGNMGGATTSRRPRGGRNLRTSLSISFEEAIFGCTKEIEVQRDEPCTTCGGSGSKPGTSPVRCQTCNGAGKVRDVRNAPFGLGSFVNVTTCPTCQGSGEEITSPCPTCNGAKLVPNTRRLSINIPAGVDDGIGIRLSGEGELGGYGGPPGDLHVYISVQPHQFFVRQGNHIILELGINVAQAALGDVVMVPTLDGEEELSLPAGTQTGDVFRIKGRGVPYLRRSGRGDQQVVVTVQTPTKLTARQRELFEELGDTLGKEIVAQSERGFLDRVREALGL
jgi:molecular chaperone DnaJ